MQDTILRLLNEILAQAKDKGINKSTLSERAGFAANAVSKVLKAKDVKLSTIERLANAAGMRIRLEPNNPVVAKISNGTLFDFK